MYRNGGCRRKMWLSFDSIFSSSTAPLISGAVESFLHSRHRILFWNPSGNSIRMEQRPAQLLLKGIAILSSIYSPTSVRLCAFVCVFHYCSSEIAPSVPGAREAPDSALTRISTSVPRDNPTHRWGQDEISIHSRVEIRGSDRGWRKLKKRGIKGHKVSAV